MTPAIRRSILAGFKGAVYVGVGVMLAAYTLPAPEPEYRDVIVSRQVLVASKPDTIVKWKERIVWRTVERETSAVAPGGAAETVATFCNAATPQAPNLGPEATPEVTPQPVVPMLFDAGTFDGRTLKLWEVRANGDAATESFAVRAPFTFAVKDGQALVRGSRTWWVRPAITAVGVFGAGYLTGRVLD